MTEYEKEQNKMLRGVMSGFLIFVTIFLSIYIGLSITFDKTLDDVISAKTVENVEQTDILDSSEVLEIE